MKLAVAQLRPLIGNVPINLTRHIELVELGVAHDADLIVFPELSLTGYEPSLAQEMALSPDDMRLAAFQVLSDTREISIAVGLPIKASNLPFISTLVFRPRVGRWNYSKQFLHSDEMAYFQSGHNANSIIIEDPKVALAICYELSIPEHSQMAFRAGATAYVASVAKNLAGIRTASRRLAELAAANDAIVMMANCRGEMDGTMCAGGSIAWGRAGNVLGRLDETTDGVIVVDYESEETVTDSLSRSRI